MTEINNEREQAVRAALAGVIDPELRRPITELNMVKSVEVGPDGATHIGVYLTISACPKKSEITERITAASTSFCSRNWARRPSLPGTTL